MHIQCPGHSIKSFFEEGLIIFFPGFHTKAIVGVNDIYLDATPCSDNSVNYASSDPNSSPLFNHITQLQTDIAIESCKVDNILESLRQYYNEIKTKRQLNLEFPAGFRCKNQWQTACTHHASLNHSTVPETNFTPDDLSDLGLLSDISETTELSSCLENNNNSSSTTVHVPIIRSVDKSSSSLPNLITMSEDYLHVSVGFR